jgi:hypothetical protein
VNWGGLVDHGVGNADYDQANDRADPEKIQNPPAEQHVGPYAWQNGVEYEYRSNAAPSSPCRPAHTA